MSHSTEPGSPYDKLVQELNTVKQELVALHSRQRQSDDTILALLKTIKKGEEAFELRVARVLFNCFNGLTHNLEHSIEALQHDILEAQRGFTIEIVNGKDVKECADTFIVRKTEDGYNYSSVTNPEVVNNTNCEAISVYFEQHPELFNSSDELLFNLLVSKEQLSKESKGNGEG